MQRAPAQQEVHTCFLRQVYTATSTMMPMHVLVKQMAPAAQSDVHVKHLCFSALPSVPSPRTFCSFLPRSRSSDAFLLPPAGDCRPSLGTTVTKDKILLFLPMWARRQQDCCWRGKVARKQRELQLWPSV